MTTRYVTAFLDCAEAIFPEGFLNRLKSKEILTAEAQTTRRKNKNEKNWKCKWRNRP